MSALVKRLRAWPENVLEGNDLCKEAAEEIEGLLAERDALRAALEIAYSHLEPHALRISHSKDLAKIEAARAANSAEGGR